jgi:hypothetical protein
MREYNRTFNCGANHLRIVQSRPWAEYRLSEPCGVFQAPLATTR